MPTQGRELIFVTATWSTVGRLMKPMLKKICSTHGLRLREVNIDSDRGAVGVYKPRTLPSVILRDGEDELRRWDGFTSGYEIQRDLEHESGRSSPPAPGDLDRESDPPL